MFSVIKPTAFYKKETDDMHFVSKGWYLKKLGTRSDASPHNLDSDVAVFTLVLYKHLNLTTIGFCIKEIIK